MTPKAIRQLRLYMRLLGVNLSQIRMVVRMTITICILHYAVLILGHIVCGAISPGFFNTAGSFWGLFMVGLLIMAFWWFGGPELELLVIASTEVEVAKKVAGAIHTFIAIETLTNAIFALLPGSGPIQYLMLALSAVLGITVIRLKIGGSIPWERWQMLPIANLVIGLAAMYFTAWSGNKPSLSDPAFWFFAAVIVGVASYAMPGKISMQAAIALAVVGGLLCPLVISFGWQIRPVKEEMITVLHGANQKELHESAQGIQKQLAEKKITTIEANKKFKELTKEHERTRQQIDSDELYNPTDILPRFPGGKFLALLLIFSAVATLFYLIATRKKGESHAAH